MYYKRGSSLLHVQNTYYYYYFKSLFAVIFYKKNPCLVDLLICITVVKKDSAYWKSLKVTTEAIKLPQLTLWNTFSTRFPFPYYVVIYTAYVSIAIFRMIWWSSQKQSKKKNYCAKFPMEHVINSLSIDKKCINSFTFTFCT